MDNDDIQLKLVEDSSAVQIDNGTTNEVDYNSLDYGSYSSDVMASRSWSNQTEYNFHNRSTSSLGVDYTSYFYNDYNLNKINDYWRRINQRVNKDENIWNPEYNQNYYSMYEYAKAFSRGKLDYYSIGWGYLNAFGEGKTQDSSAYAVYASLIGGNFGNFDNLTDKRAKDLMDRAVKFTNRLWSTKTAFDIKMCNGEKEFLPIRIDLDEINEGYSNKYANENSSNYGIVYMRGDQLASIAKDGSNSSDKFTSLISKYASAYNLNDGEGVGYIFIPASQRQMTPLIMAQLSDCRSHDYTDETLNYNEVSDDNSVFVNYNLTNQFKPTDDNSESHATYTALRALGIVSNDYNFDGITNFNVGSDFGYRSGIVGGSAVTGSLTGASTGQLIGISVGAAAEGVGSVPGGILGTAIGGLAGGVIGLGAGISALDNNSAIGEFNRMYNMKDMIYLGDDLFEYYNKVKSELDKENKAEKAVTSSGITMKAIPQQTLNKLIGAGLLKPTVAKDINKTEIENVAEALKGTDFTTNNYKVYTRDTQGVYRELTKDMVEVFQKALRNQSKLSYQSLNINTGVYDDEGGQNATSAFYEIEIPVKDLIEAQYGSTFLNSITSNKAEDKQFVESHVGEHGLDGFIAQSAFAKGTTKKSAESLTLEDKIRFRVPVTIADTREADAYSDPLLLAANEVASFGSQRARMQLLKDSFFGDLSITSNHVLNENGEELDKFVMDFNGKHTIEKADIASDIYSNKIYNDNAEVEQLVMWSRRYMAAEELIRYYLNASDDPNIPVHYIDEYVNSCANVLNLLQGIQRFDGGTNVPSEERQFYLKDEDVKYMAEKLKAVSPDLYELVMDKIDELISK